MTKGEIYAANHEEEEWQDDQTKWRPFNGEDIGGKPQKTSCTSNLCPDCGKEGFIIGYCRHCGYPN
jgi:hypothetical protein